MIGQADERSLPIIIKKENYTVTEYIIAGLWAN